MSNRVHKFQAASAAREDIVIEFSDGRIYTFDGDVDTDAFLNFVVEFGEAAGAEEMPVHVLVPMLEMLVGFDRLDEIRAETKLSEIIQIGRTLWLEYMGIVGMMDEPVEDSEEDAEGKPPASD